MNKETEKQELKESRRAYEDLIIVMQERVKEIDKQLAKLEEEKPEIRHGVYGLEDNDAWICITNECVPGGLRYWFKDGFGYLEKDKKQIIFGDIFQEMQTEDLERFDIHDITTGVHIEKYVCFITCDNKILMTTNRIEIMRIDLNEFYTFICKCKQLYLTARRQENG